MASSLNNESSGSESDNLSEMTWESANQIKSTIPLEPSNYAEAISVGLPLTLGLACPACLARACPACPNLPDTTPILRHPESCHKASDQFISTIEH